MTAVPHRVAWESGNATVERHTVDMPSEHYAELWADKLRSVGTSRVVVTRLPEEGGSRMSEVPTTQPTVVIMVNPDDVNLPSVKALAADYNATVIGSPHVPHMQALFIDPAALRAPWEEDE